VKNVTKMANFSRVKSEGGLAEERIISKGGGLLN
jgi:hypothetical protein